ncbi:hypothetical protein GUJ93_ZPchr0001g31849 [Zizania palustris]|uniref:Homeobox domain-containing protein n=1 Tax=Zizania palustris TaxID=103762 RepID=A0A8J5V9I1_ZIZPA|nr:hypothetical protein GUJ93_ZPchr0001g31849 [Zizania palustris]KAG8056055.1 hypothetical protein GUJ93_ZPchr0001g31849 [Zizania palustris]
MFAEGAGCSNNNNGNGGGNMRDLDINQPASGGEEEDFPMGSVEEDDEERGVGGGPHRPKKLRLSKEQSRLLEESFRLNHTLTPKQKEALAIKLKLRPRQVEVWFQNRRARTKLKQTEIECEYLKRCFGSLTEENRRLQREVEELRAMRVAPPTVLSPHTRRPLPASALTIISEETRGHRGGRGEVIIHASRLISTVEYRHRACREPPPPGATSPSLHPPPRRDDLCLLLPCRGRRVLPRAAAAAIAILTFSLPSSPHVSATDFTGPSYWRMVPEEALRYAKKEVMAAEPVVDDPDLCAPLKNVSQFKTAGCLSPPPPRRTSFYLHYSSQHLRISLYVLDSHNLRPLTTYVRDFIKGLAAKLPSFWNRTRRTDHFLVACHDWGAYTTTAHGDLRTQEHHQGAV